MYIPLHGRSTYSFLESVGTPKVIIKRAKELGFPTLALTDLDVMYGAIQFYQAANAEGIKSIVGLEVGFVLNVDNAPAVNAIGSICLLAKNTQGYLNLMKITSFAGQQGVAGRPKIDITLLEKYKEGILVFSGGVDSWIAKLLSNGEPLSKAEEIFTMLKDKLGAENCYLEVIAQNEAKEPEIEKINKAVLLLAERVQASCLVSNIYIYPKPEDKSTQELAMAIKDNLKLYDPQHRVLTTENHLMTEEEIRKICLENGYSEAQIDSWIQVTEKIADLCSLKIDMGQLLFPKYEADPEILELYEKNKDQLICE
ncbi:MAG: PHP domain-containing protein [Candidatus Absconditicoccaceae bacterium]